MKLTSLLFTLVGTTVPVLSALLARQDPDDTPDLYLCSNPNFNKDCNGCACESLTDLVTVDGYGGPPCFPLPDDLRVGNPQGVSSARAYEGWSCTLFDNEFCEDNGPDSMYQVPFGLPGAASLDSFDDRAVAYQCYAIE
ncbi:hypothetical protein F4818DRAFT_440624 [Hypoxylon cercidicola]|nr:hypothetical protein F4818DRAFT_440624 [Hypoxylon cercidicola]